MLGAAVCALSFGAEYTKAVASELKGVALVIGQSKYQHLPTLSNAKNDAQAVTNLFEALGFNVTSTTDRDARKLERDIQNFVDDAAGADVAAIYYSGHGIEAGGENWLLPVDADVAALDSAEKFLVPVSPLVDRLRAAVPLTLMFLDACRTNPFPPGSLLRSGNTHAPISAGGLGAGKGVIDPAAGNDANDLGAVIAFAAAPGQTALDGPIGGNSPYASALLRHLQASTKTEFGLVMRMVAEEVYLKTEGRQRPWTNETLFRQLYFGGKPEIAGTEEGKLNEGRRSLLLSISSLGDRSRLAIEQIASENHLPLDPLFGMLRQLNVDTSASPEELSRQLRAGVDTLRELQDQKDLVTQTDPEIVRLTELANQAQAEGVFSLAKDYRSLASNRAAVVSAALEKQEVDIEKRHMEVAATYANEAATAVLDFDYQAAAAHYLKASAETKKWNAAKSLEYDESAALALTNYGDLQGVNAALEDAVKLHMQILGSFDRHHRPDFWALVSSNLGIALQTLGTREAGTARLHEAIVAYRSALEVRTQVDHPIEWARTQNNLGSALWVLGIRSNDTRMLEQAAEAFRDSLRVRTREAQPVSWAKTQNNLGGVLWALADRNGSLEQLNEAITAYRAALQVRTREHAPLDWATLQNNLGIAYQTMGELTSNDQPLESAIEAYRLALEERTRGRAPLDWAASENNLGMALWSLGERRNDVQSVLAAIDAFQEALLERTRSRSVLDYAMTTSNLAEAMLLAGQLRRDIAMLRESEGYMRDAWATYQSAGLDYGDFYSDKLKEIQNSISALE